MRSKLLGAAVFAVLLIGGGAALNEGSIVAAGGGASSPGKDTYRYEWAQGGWRIQDIFGRIDEGWAYARKDVATGQAFLDYQHFRGELTWCDAQGRFTLFGQMTRGHAPAQVDVKVKTAEASAFMGLGQYLIDDCEGPPVLVGNTGAMVQMSLVSDGNKATGKSGSCYPVVGGEICYGDAWTRTGATGSVIEGSNFAQLVTGAFGQSRNWSAFNPY